MEIVVLFVILGWAAFIWVNRKQAPGLTKKGWDEMRAEENQDYWWRGDQ